VDAVPLAHLLLLWPTGSDQLGSGRSAMVAPTTMFLGPMLGWTWLRGKE
jgi:hypothetical protein